MTKWNPQFLVTAAKAAGVPYVIEQGWLNEKIDPYGADFKPVGIVWHHTGCNTLTAGDAPSLRWVQFPGEFAGESRACHILVSRTGVIHIITGLGCYHAGAGGPMTVDGHAIPKDLGNKAFIGIEIEASSSNRVRADNRITPKNDITKAQFENTAKFAAELCKLMSWDTEANIRHQDWAPGRKGDVNIPLASIRNEVKKYRVQKPVVVPPVVVTPPVVAVPTPPKPVKAVKPAKSVPVVTVAYVKPGKKNGDILVVQRALAAEVGLDYSTGPATFGPATKAAFKKWQKKMGMKSTTGIPSKASLKALGDKHGFTVK